MSEADATAAEVEISSPLTDEPSSDVATGSCRLAVFTHHKCASTLVYLYLQRVCELNGLRMFASHLGTAQPQPEHDVSILTNATYTQIEHAIDSPTIHIIRNPLDIIVSAYYSHRTTHTLDAWPQLHHQRSVLANCSKEAGFFLTLAFLERNEFYPQTSGPLHALRQWRFDDTRIRTIRMEDLVADISSMLGEALAENLGNAIRLPDPEEFTFERMTGGRGIGEIDETSHYRSGLPDEWRRELPEPVIAYVRAHYRALLECHYPHAIE